MRRLLGPLLLALTAALSTFTSSALAGTMPLSWSPVADPALGGYRIYYGTAPGAYSQVQDVGNVTSFSITGLTDCTQYYLAVKSYKTSGVESTGYSNEISGLPTPVVSTATPGTLQQGGTGTVTLTGANFAGGASISSTNLKITVGVTTFVSCTQLRAAVTVAADAPLGAAMLGVLNADQSIGSSASALQITAPSAPYVAATSPVEGATSVATGVRPSISFSEPMDPATIGSGTIKLLTSGGTPVAQAAGSPSLDPSGQVATIVPQAALSVGTLYQIQVAGSSTGVKDLQGTPIAATYTQATGFRTATAPTSASKADPPYWYDDADAAPTIDFLSSNDAPAGAYVAIYGDDFGAQAGTVTIGTSQAAVVSWSWRKIVATVPSGASGSIMVMTSSASASNAKSFLVHAGNVRHLDRSAATGGNGTAASPWKTFAAADAGVAPGDFVVVHGGTYTGAATDEAVFKANTSGAANNTITYFAKPGEAVFLDATTTTKQAIRVNGNFINVVGFAMGGAKYQGILLGGTDNQAVDNEVKDATADAGKGQGFNINGARSKALGNYVHDNYSHGFYAYSSSTEVGYNYIARSGKNAPDARGHGIQFFVIDPGPAFTNGKIYRNFLTGNNRGAITIGSYSSGADVYENLITANDEQCVYIGYTALSTSFRNNVCYKNGLDTSTGVFAEIELDASSGASGADLYNNVVTGPIPMKISAGFSSSVNLGNNFYQSATTWIWGGTSYTSLAAWQAASGKDQGAGAGNPGFTDTLGGDFRPAGGSPLIDAGSDAKCARPVQGARCDAGAFETPGSGPSPVAPVVSSASPSDAATGQAISVQPAVTFSVAIDPATVTRATVLLLGPGAAPVTQAVGSPSLDATGRLATIAPAVSLAYNTSYQIYVIGGASGVKNLAGTALAGSFQQSTGFQTGAAPDTTPPTVGAASPVDGATGQANSVRPAVTLSEALSPASITTATVRLLGPGGAAVTQAAGSPSLDATGRVATIVTAANLAFNTSYQIQVVGGASGVKDLAGNALGATFVQATGFRTGTAPDTTPPTIATVSPSAGATGVALAAQPTLGFSEPIGPATVNTTSILLLKPDGSSVAQAAGSPLLGPAGTTVTVIPAAPLAWGTTYRLQVLGGSAGIKDLAGNALVSTLTQSPGFTTVADTPPAVTGTDPVDGAVGQSVALRPTISFSEALDPASVVPSTVLILGPGGTPIAQAGVSPSLDATGRTVTIVPAAALSYDTVYEFRVIGGSLGVKDLQGTPLAANYAQTNGFRTGPAPDTTPPSVVSVSPSGGSRGVARNVRPTISFSEALRPASVTQATVLLLGPDDTPIAQSASSPALDASGTTATITPAQSLAWGAIYRVQVVGDAPGVKDAAGNPVRGIFTQSPGFTTIDDPPAVTGASPADGTANVSVSVTPTVSFSEALDPASVSSGTVRLIGPGAVLVPQQAGSPALDPAGRVVTITPAQPFANDTVYQIQVIGGSAGVKDLQGTALVQTYAQSLGFRTQIAADTIPPAVSSSAPANNATGIDVSVHPTITFSEPMDPASISASTVRLEGPGGILASQVPGSPLLDAAGRVATIIPAVSLAAETFYRLQVTGGTAGVKDAAGNPMAAGFGDNPGFLTLGGLLMVTGTSPADGTTGVPVSLRAAVTFSKVMDPAWITPSTVRLIGPGAVPVAQADGSPALDSSGRIAVIVPAQRLPYDTVYQVQVIGFAEGVKDFSGSTLGSTYQHSIGLRTARVPVPPIVSRTDPAPGAPGVPTGAEPLVTFTNGMNPDTLTSASIELIDAVGSPVPQGAGSPVLDVSGTTARIIPAAPLAGGTTYRVRVRGGPGGVGDLEGLTMETTYIQNPGFRTDGGTPPAIVATTPLDGASNVAATIHPTVTFNVALAAATVTPATVRIVGPGGVYVPHAAGSPGLDATGRIVTVVPAQRLGYNTVFQLQVVGYDDGIRTTLGATMEGTFQHGIGFRISPPSVPPTVSGTSPSPGALAVAVNALPTVTFSASMMASSITSASLVLLDANGASVPQGVGSPSLDSSGRIATITPDHDLANESGYQVWVAGGAGGVQDALGSEMDSTYVQSPGFRTATAVDVQPPGVVSATPLNASLGNPLNVHPTVTFSEPMDPASITKNTLRLKGPDGIPVLQVPGSPFLDPTGRIATIVPAASLWEFSYYRLQVIPGAGGVKDLAGNAMPLSFNANPGFQTLNLPPPWVPWLHRTDAR